jgi:ankyrin repeat protein
MKSNTGLLLFESIAKPSLTYCAKPTHTESLGWDTQTWCCATHYADIVAVLIGGGANLNCQDTSGNTALWIACENGSLLIRYPERTTIESQTVIDYIPYHPNNFNCAANLGSPSAPCVLAT